MIIKQLNSKEYFYDYFEQSLSLIPYLMMRNKFGNDFEKDIGKYLTLSCEDVSILVGFVLTDNFKTLKATFSNSYTTHKLGEGRATVFFLKIYGKEVMLFRDSRGTSIELEKNITKKEFNEIMFELFKIIYENMLKIEKEKIDEILKIFEDHRENS